MPGQSNMVYVYQSVSGPSNRTQPSQLTVRGGLAVGQNSGTNSDTRLTLETTSSRVSQRVQISVVGYASGGCWLASSRELFGALQASISAIQGPARLGVPDARNEGYQVLFAIIDEPEDEITFGENILSIPDSNVLQLFVSSVNSAPRLTQLLSSSYQNSSSKATKDKPAIPLTDAEFDFLDGLVKRTPGCDAFRGKHNQRLVNLARVQFWRFAAGFCEKYHKTSWPTEIERSGTNSTVSKAAIETVLGLGQTALNEAIHMTRILSVYYDEGPHQSEEVVQMVKTVAGTADKNNCLAPTTDPQMVNATFIWWCLCGLTKFSKCRGSDNASIRVHDMVIFVAQFKKIVRNKPKIAQEPSFAWNLEATLYSNYLGGSGDIPTTVTGDVRAPSPSSDGPAAKKPRLDVPTVPPASAIPPKAPRQTKMQKRKAQYSALPEPCSPDDVLWREINDVLGEAYVNNSLSDKTDRQSPFEYHQELEVLVQVVALSSTGSALATPSGSSRPWVVVVPFALPGETIRVKVYRNARMHSVADLLEITTPNLELRDNSRVQCKYFGTCGGCQYQTHGLQICRDSGFRICVHQQLSELDEPTEDIFVHTSLPQRMRIRTQTSARTARPRSYSISTGSQLCCTSRRRRCRCPSRYPGPRAALRRARVARPLLLLGTGGVQAVAGVSSAQMGRKPALLADALAWTQTAQLMRSVGGQEETETFAPRRHAGVATVQRPRGIRKSVPLANALVWVHTSGDMEPALLVDALAWMRVHIGDGSMQAVFLQTALSTDRAADAQLRKPTLLANALLADTLAWVCGSVQLSLASKSFRRPRGLTRSAAIRKTALLADVLAWVRAHVGDSGVQAVAGVCTGRQKDTETAPRSLLSWLTHAVQRSLSCC
ncbi:hypothetical protein GGX14DRAFT_607794 [Mycena pura]|uniref:TRAM domain-containing protein n=1 Tax=Mycena pura TaxID=153505 RepID=A0AAD6UMT1_9AGAR|nr:hypothetical protein GGX14DRAFT_607794 [Mycena pura]